MTIEDRGQKGGDVLKNMYIFLRAWLVFVVAEFIVREAFEWSVRPVSIMFALHPYAAAYRVFISVGFLILIFWGARLFWLMLNEKLKKPNHTDG